MLWILLTVTLLLAGCTLVGVALALPRCAHLDEEGHSALYWQRDPAGQLRGWCPICGRVTRGWRIG